MNAAPSGCKMRPPLYSATGKLLVADFATVSFICEHAPVADSQFSCSEPNLRSDQLIVHKSNIHCDFIGKLSLLRSVYVLVSSRFGKTRLYLIAFWGIIK